MCGRKTLIKDMRSIIEELAIDEWLDEHGFDFFERHYTKNKHLVDVDVLVDDSPEKLEDFDKKSVNGGRAICMRQTWNKSCQKKYISIDRLSDIISLV